jgi:ABC-type multidrug transport system fused ATPase/permease subunit
VSLTNTVFFEHGSGKSSLVHCLLRLLDLDSGSIAIDGVDLSNLPPEFIRARISAVPQDPYLFDEATIRYNLDPTHHVSDEEIVQALEKVRLWDKIQERGGLDAVVKDEDFFSKGEKQLLAFARGILRKSKILILDEFDGSLDEESSSVVYDVLRSEWLRGCTVFAITHRLEGVVGLFDKVVVLDSGRVVEFDEPGRLVEREGSAFASLFEASARGR